MILKQKTEPKLPKINEKKRNVSQILTNLSYLTYYIYCNIDVNLLHNFFVITIYEMVSSNCLRALFRKIKMKKTKCLSFKKSSLLSAQKCMDFDGQPRLACNTEWCHNRYEIVLRVRPLMTSLIFGAILDLP